MATKNYWRNTLYINTANARGQHRKSDLILMMKSNDTNMKHANDNVTESTTPQLCKCTSTTNRPDVTFTTVSTGNNVSNRIVIHWRK